MPLEWNNTLTGGSCDITEWLSSGTSISEIMLDNTVHLEPQLMHLEPQLIKEQIENLEVEQTMDYTPKRILRSGDRTIVFWQDGTKTIVKKEPGAPDSTYTAFAAALAIKIFGSNSAVNRLVKKKVYQQKPDAKSGKSHDEKPKK